MHALKYKKNSTFIEIKTLSANKTVWNSFFLKIYVLFKIYVVPSETIQNSCFNLHVPESL